MIYRVEKERIDLPRRIARVAMLVGIYFLAQYIFHLIWPPAGPAKEGFEDGIIVAVTAFFFDSIRRSYELEVDESAIHMRRTFLSDCKVRKGRIQYLREFPGNFLHEPGLRLSENGAIGRFFSGYVSIPASLPEYQTIKATALTWMRIS